MTMIPDIQNLDDERRKPINQVGIRSIKHRLNFKDQDDLIDHPTIATADMYVGLSHHKKGTHMSRFVAFLNDALHTVSLASFSEQLIQMTERLEAKSGYLTLTFPYLVDKKAPVTQAISSVDYEVSLMGSVVDGRVRQLLRLVVPITTLCPCSKEISAYGAHNQRSYITLTAVLSHSIDVKALIAAIEAQGSCEVYALLKRPDEKHVTEYAYDHPKFVEDLVRDLATMLDDYEGITEYRIESENIESIHNHSAYAMIETENLCHSLL